ncbi:early nodulin-93-like [Populus alba x Populus x berolinensis]|nr:early nodulin-93-like [Populus alba x Populus x berolinensis]
MGIPSELRHYWAQKTLTNQNLNHNGYDINNRRSLLIASPAEEQKILQARLCTQEGVRAGVKAAVITCVATAVPTLTAVRVIPWAKANLNYTAQALIISAGMILI